MTLTEFLLARLAEDEAMAREFVGESSVEWMEGHGPWSLDFLDDRSLDLLGITPARVLADVEAKRRIVEAADDQLGGPNWRDAMQYALERLASVYSDHPDYNPDWS